MPSKRVSIVSCKLVRECPSIMYDVRKVSSPDDVARLVKDFLEDADREMMVLLCLDRKGQPTHLQIIAIGTLHSTLVHPREVFKAAILSNSASIILAHNHPSGDPCPSQDDIDITKCIKEAGNLLGIELLDHIIIGCNSHYSLRSSGQL